MKKLLLLLTLGFFLNNISAQDIHFSQYNMSPMTLNPANIGAFEGTLRIGGIYRGQWASVIGNSGSFKTPSLYVDAPIIRGFRKKDWVGAGLMFFTDKVGKGKLTHTAAKLGASYHLALNKKATTFLTFGAQYGQASRKLDPTLLTFEQGYLGNPTGNYNAADQVDFLNITEANAQWTDIDGGITLRSQLNKTMSFSIGYAMYHIAQGKYGLVTSTGSGGTASPQTSSDKIGRRSVATGTFNIKLNDKFMVSPSFLYQTMSGADEIIVQGLCSYLFNEEKDINLLFGLGYRLGDAIHPMVGAQIKSLRLGLAYDVNISNLKTASDYRGGFELAAWYILKIYKPAVVKTKVLCPRF
ncbi:MAG: PorP/SprF family type IX secretion system membrane protein [Lewinellaceae bacterium]|nr:PorP/SprF family type IX secretion system membrane protein [Saprospiraceae bacterium]MCB9343981.1 PorP/SprF family type IX secretion system membrane protein [Lewinellaceae bacterium]